MPSHLALAVMLPGHNRHGAIAQAGIEERDGTGPQDPGLVQALERDAAGRADFFPQPGREPDRGRGVGDADREASGRQRRLVGTNLPRKHRRELAVGVAAQPEGHVAAQENHRAAIFGVMSQRFRLRIGELAGGGKEPRMMQS